MYSDTLKCNYEISNIFYLTYHIWHTNQLAHNLLFQVDILVVHVIVFNCVSLNHCYHLLESFCMVLLHMFWTHYSKSYSFMVLIHLKRFTFIIWDTPLNF